MHSRDPLHVPEHPGYFTRAKLALRAFFVLAKDQGHTVAAPVLNITMDAEVFTRLAEGYRRTEEGRSLLRERPDLQAGAFDLRALQGFPEGTLGRALGDYYEANGITPFVTSYPVRNEVEYLAKRYREIHDMLHIVTGYGTDPIGELELQAFVFGNIGLRHPVLILTLTGVFMPMGLPPVWKYFGKLRDAYRRGRAIPDVALRPRYERYWSQSIDAVRSELGLTVSATR